MKKILIIEKVPYIVYFSEEEIDTIIKKAFETSLVEINIFDANTLSYKQVIDTIDEAEHNIKNFSAKHRKCRMNRYKDE